jgi:hypothetical protein
LLVGRKGEKYRWVFLELVTGQALSPTFPFLQEIKKPLNPECARFWSNVCDEPTDNVVIYGI